MFKRFKRHKHDWELVAVNDQFHIEWTDRATKEYIQQRFYRCSCGARKHTDTVPDFTTHRGISSAKKNWVETGVVPKNSYHPTDNTYFVKIDDIERKQLDPVLEYQKTLDELVQSLGVVINRDFDLETRYPKLREAADEYHRRLDKYRNFESLKETGD